MQLKYPARILVSYHHLCWANREYQRLYLHKAMGRRFEKGTKLVVFFNYNFIWKSGHTVLG